MIVFLGGKNSTFINDLAEYLKKFKEERVSIISSNDLLGNKSLKNNFAEPDAKYIIGFCNKNSKKKSIDKSLKLLQKSLMSLKKYNVRDNQIYILGSESHLGEYFEMCEPFVKKVLLRDHYAFDSLVKRKVFQSIFPKINIINIPSIEKKRSIFNQISRFIIANFIAKCHSYNYRGNLNRVSIDTIANQILTTKNPKTFESKKEYKETIKIKNSWIFNFIPVKALKFSASIIKYNIDNKIIPVKKNNLIPRNIINCDFFIVTPLNKIDINFHITFQNIINIVNKTNLRWIICTSPNIVKEIKSLTKNFAKIDVIVEQYPSIYGGYNEFLKNNLNNSGYYLPLSAGDIILDQGLEEGMSICVHSKPNLLFLSVLKHGQYIYRKKPKLELISTGTHSFVTGHSAACFMKISAHKNWGLYDLSYKLAADNDFFEKIRLESPESILYSNITLGYFPPGGISQSDYLSSYIEIFRSRVKNKKSLFKEIMFLAKRIYKQRNLL